MHAVAAQQGAGGTDRKGSCVVIDMPAFIGVRHHRVDVAGIDQRCETPGKIDETIRRLAVGNLEGVKPLRADVRERERGLRLGAAHLGIGGRRGETGTPHHLLDARRAIGDMHHARAWQSRELPADADHFVIGMRGDDEAGTRKELGRARGRHGLAAGRR